MSLVLFDAPGPRTRRTYAIVAVIIAIGSFFASSATVPHDP